MSHLAFRALKYTLAGATTTVLASEYASASGDALLPAWIKWPNSGLFSTYDYSSVRRGFEVYKQVCSACHSMQFLKFRQLVGITHTEAQIKAIAAEYEIQHEEPNEEGEWFNRPRGLLDGFPAPYEHETNARLANNGANPPDLSLMIYGRTHGLDGLLVLGSFGKDTVGLTQISLIFEPLPKNPPSHTAKTTSSTSSPATATPQPASPWPKAKTTTPISPAVLSAWPHHSTTKSSNTKTAPQPPCPN